MPGSAEKREERDDECHGDGGQGDGQDPPPLAKGGVDRFVEMGAPVLADHDGAELDQAREAPPAEPFRAGKIADPSFSEREVSAEATVQVVSADTQARFSVRAPAHRGRLVRVRPVAEKLAEADDPIAFDVEDVCPAILKADA